MEKLTASRDDNVLIGSTVICRYLGINSVTTLIMWIEGYGLPVMKRPDGMWMSSMTAIDEWIWLAAGAELENRAYSRGTNVSAEKALARAQARVERQRAFNMRLPTGPVKASEREENSDGSR